MRNEHIRLIFGLKLRQLRQDRGLSLQELSGKSGISNSYLNEIEKGKKYPKTDKITALASALNVEYDELVSLKLGKKLEPLAKLLRSNLLTELPFGFFGLDISQAVDLFSAAPTKLSAFINAIFEIGKNYNLSVESFYFAALRSYQEMHQNYFPEIEEEAEAFSKKHAAGILSEAELAGLLKSEYGVEIQHFDEEDQPVISNMRSIFRPTSKILMINKRISSDQRAYTMAKELGFQFMNLETRPYTSSSMDVKSFEAVLNNFKASYFAGAILINKDALVKDLEKWFSNKKWEPEAMNDMVEKFQATPETLYYRISNVLPKFFGIDQLLFMRLHATPGSHKYYIDKEMHLSKRLGPQENKEEHYCRRWVSIDVLDHLSSLQTAGKYEKPLVGAQYSHLKEANDDYFVIAMARPLNISRQVNISVSLAFEINDNLKSKIKFLSDIKIDRETVNQTCERCSIFDCKKRMTAPVILQKERRLKEVKRVLEGLS